MLPTNQDIGVDTLGAVFTTVFVYLLCFTVVVGCPRSACILGIALGVDSRPWSVMQTGRRICLNSLVAYVYHSLRDGSCMFGIATF